MRWQPTQPLRFKLWAAAGDNFIIGSVTDPHGTPKAIAASGVPVLGMVLAFCFAGIFSACKGRREASDVTATPANRQVLGVASAADPIPIFDKDRLNSDMAYRRLIGWQLAYSALSPVQVKNLAIATAYEGNAEDTIPRWMSWYDGYELTELFDMLFGSKTFGAAAGLPSQEARKRSLAFSETELQTVFSDHSKKDLLGWTTDRYVKELGKIKDLRHVQGLVTGQDGLPADSGHGITVFSPEIIDHVLRNYSEIVDCYITRDGLTYETKPKSEDNFSLCLKAEFPGARETELESRGVAVAIKATWQKVVATSGELNPMPVYKHDAESLLKALKAGTWTNTSKSIVPQKEQIFTVRIGEDKTYMLTGLHVTSKQARHWIWVSLWWAEDPDEDFGADRPQFISRLGRGLENYKMCVVTDFEEGDPAPWKFYEEPKNLGRLSASENLDRSRRLKGLGKSLRAVHEFATAKSERGHAPTWCSNPYIELGDANNRTNCIGCHQHAGSSLTGSEPIMDDEAFPNTGRHLMRTNFVTDYLWSLSQPPDDFAARIGEIRSLYAGE